ncbi:MAG TPA: LytTR family DNA-binding domain-containing protein [Puia sp.]|nr:LytTR family DNA-binding domain-containing protein [Puia sp.]
MAVQKAISPPPSQTDEYIFARSDKKMIRVNIREELLEKLPGQFTRIHNSYIINGDHITRVEGNYVLVGDKNLPIGISYREAFAEFIQQRAL